MKSAKEQFSGPILDYSSIPFLIVSVVTLILETSYH